MAKPSLGPKVTGARQCAVKASAALTGLDISREESAHTIAQPLNDDRSNPRVTADKRVDPDQQGRPGPGFGYLQRRWACRR
ncbi:MAG: hypothetical protein Q9181_007943 [Wetmoreana brouardii]